MSPEATALGLRIMDLINQRVKAHEAPYCDAYGHRYRLSARSLFLDFPVALFNRGGVDAKAAIKGAVPGKSTLIPFPTSSCSNAPMTAGA